MFLYTRRIYAFRCIWICSDAECWMLMYYYYYYYFHQSHLGNRARVPECSAATAQYFRFIRNEIGRTSAVCQPRRTHTQSGSVDGINHIFIWYARDACNRSSPPSSHHLSLLLSCFNFYYFNLCVSFLCFGGFISSHQPAVVTVTPKMICVRCACSSLPQLGYTMKFQRQRYTPGYQSRLWDRRRKPSKPFIWWWCVLFSFVYWSCVLVADGQWHAARIHFHLYSRTDRCTIERIGIDEARRAFTTNRFVTRN